MGLGCREALHEENLTGCLAGSWGGWNELPTYRKPRSKSEKSSKAPLQKLALPRGRTLLCLRPQCSDPKNWASEVQGRKFPEDCFANVWSLRLGDISNGSEQEEHIHDYLKSQTSYLKKKLGPDTVGLGWSPRAWQRLLSLLSTSWCSSVSPNQLQVRRDLVSSSNQRDERRNDTCHFLTRWASL